MNYSTPHLRVTGTNKNYYLHQMQVFADHFNNREIICVSYGKQDTRGGFSITLIDKRRCVPSQKFFASKDELLGFVTGFNAARPASKRKLTQIPF